MPRPLVAPSILAADFARLRAQVEEAEQAGADWFHLDIMDGHFVPNISFGPGIVRTVRECTARPLDVHLMITDPDRYIGEFRSAGADRITIHQEAAAENLHRIIRRIKELGAQAGVSINPATPVSVLEPVAAEADLILIMSVHPGFGGQKFMESSLEKIAQTRALLTRVRSHAYLEVDGGIDPSNARRVLDAGTDILVAGTSIFRQQDMRAAIASLRALS